jgi:hypothetical protein
MPSKVQNDLNEYLEEYFAIVLDSQTLKWIG